MFFNDIEEFLNQAESVECTTIPVLKGELKDLNLSAIFREMRAASDLSGAEAMNRTKVALAQNAYIDEYDGFAQEIDDSYEQALEKGYEYYAYSHYCCLLEYNDDNTNYEIGFNLEMRVLMEVETRTPVAVNVYYHRDRSTKFNQGDRKREVIQLINTTYNYQEKSRLGLLASAAEITEHFLHQTIGCAQKSPFHHDVASKQVYEAYCF